jgi:hypothetical protein
VLERAKNSLSRACSGNHPNFSGNPPTCSTDTENHNKHVWKAKLPLKIKIFMWLLQQDAILTKKNLSKKNWQGDKSCSF